MDEHEKQCLTKLFEAIPSRLSVRSFIVETSTEENPFLDRSIRLLRYVVIEELVVGISERASGLSVSVFRSIQDAHGGTLPLVQVNFGQRNSERTLLFHASGDRFQLRLPQLKLLHMIEELCWVKLTLYREQRTNEASKPVPIMSPIWNRSI